MSTESKRPAVLTPNVLIPAGTAFIIALGGWQSYKSIITEINDGDSRLTKAVQDVHDDIQQMRSDALLRDSEWRSKMRAYLFELQKENDSMEVENGKVHLRVPPFGG